jgi:hypothetical protein
MRQISWLHICERPPSTAHSAQPHTRPTQPSSQTHGERICNWDASGRWLFACEKGLDKIIVYRLDAAGAAAGAGGGGARSGALRTGRWRLAQGTWHRTRLAMST